MERVEFSDEVIFIFVAVGHSLEGSDLVVDTFLRSTGNWIIVPVQDAVAVAIQSIGHGDQDFDSRRASSATPVCQKLCRDGFGRLLPDLTEIFFEVVSHRQRMIQGQGFVQSCAFIL